MSTLPELKSSKRIYPKRFISDLNNIKINIYPNPTTNGLVNLEIENNYEKLIIEIRNISGELVYNRQIYDIEEKSVINLYNLKKGMYFIKLIFNDTIRIEKVVVD